MRTEDKLVLLLAHRNLSPSAELEARKLLEQEILWPVLLKRALDEQVFPLLYRNLRTIGLGRIPEDIRAELAARYRSNAARNMVLERELRAVLQLFWEYRIPAIPLKGLPLAEALYGDVSLRVCEDIDVLLPQPLVIKALRLLAQQGYKSQFTEPLEKSLLLRRGIECSLTRREREFTYLLEVHWGLFLDAELEGAILADLWSDARQSRFGGVDCLYLSPEWEILFLAVHAARHEWKGLKWMVDIHEICLASLVDWEKLKVKAEKFGWDYVLRLTFSASCQLWQTPIPETIGATRLPRWIRLFPSGQHDTAIPTSVFHRSLLLPRSKRIAYLARGIFVPSMNENQLITLSGPLALLYYPLRLWRVFTISVHSVGGWIKKAAASVFRLASNSCLIGVLTVSSIPLLCLLGRVFS